VAPQALLPVHDISALMDTWWNSAWQARTNYINIVLL